MYIIEGIRHNVSYAKLGKELNIKLQNVEKTLNRICDRIVKSFYEDIIDLHFVNESKGKYKKCSRCGEVKLVNQFSKNGNRLRSNCKNCK